MEETTKLPAKYLYEFDQTIASSMPESWVGNARMKAYEQAQHLPESLQRKAIDVADSVARKRDASPEAIASAVVRKLEERQ